MTSVAKALMISATLTALSIGSVVLLLIAYLTGCIPVATKLVYEGYHFEIRDLSARTMVIDDPSTANIYIMINDQPILPKQLTREHFAKIGFEPYTDYAMTNSQSPVHSMAIFENSGKLQTLYVTSEPVLTIPFARIGSPPLTLPLSRRQIRAYLGAPLKAEWVYCTPQWR